MGLFDFRLDLLTSSLALHLAVNHRPSLLGLQPALSILLKQLVSLKLLKLFLVLYFSLMLGLVEDLFLFLLFLFNV